MLTAASLSEMRLATQKQVSGEDSTVLWNHCPALGGEVKSKSGHEVKVWSNPDLWNWRNFWCPQTFKGYRQEHRIQIWYYLIIPDQPPAKNLPSIPHIWRWWTWLITSYLTWSAPFALPDNNLTILGQRLGHTAFCPGFSLDLYKNSNLPREFESKRAGVMKVLGEVPLLSIFLWLLLAVWGRGWAARANPAFQQNWTSLTYTATGQRVLCGSSQCEVAPTGKVLITRVACDAKNLTSIFRVTSFSQLQTLWLRPFEVFQSVKLSWKMWHRCNYI